MTKQISLVVAIAHNNAIGINNSLLEFIPGDLPRFKALTTGGTVVMGRKTFDSLPKGALPNRRNIVLSRTIGLQLTNCEVFNSIEDLLQALGEHENVFVIGGGEIYTLFVPYAQRLDITLIEKSYPQADTFFPPMDFSLFELTSQEIMPMSEKNDFVYCYQIWKRIARK